MNNLKKHSETCSETEGLRLWLVLILLALASLTSSAEAQTRPLIPDLQLSPCPDLSGIGAGEGSVTFPRTTADCMLGRLRLLPEIVLYVGLLERRIEGDDLRIELRAREVALAAEAASVATESLERALERARLAEKAKDAWYRAPTLWFVLGAVVTGALVALTAYAIDASGP